MPLLQQGKLYTLPNGKQIALYPISKLVHDLTQAGIVRDAQTIRKWENKGVTPPATLRTGQKRLYSKEHIQAFVKIAKESKLRQGLAIEKSDFSELIWKEIKRINKELGLE